MPSDPFVSRERSFEEAYFRQKDADLVDKLRSVFQTKLEKESLRKVSGITDEAVLDRLVKLSVRGELLSAFKLYPLVEIAWAHGKFQKHEADAVIAAAIKQGMPAEGEAIKRLQEWLERGPTEDGRTAWRMFAGELRKALTPPELATFRNDLLMYARRVAEVCGGVLGLFSKISPGEQRVLDSINRELTHS